MTIKGLFIRRFSGCKRAESQRENGRCVRLWAGNGGVHQANAALASEGREMRERGVVQFVGGQPFEEDENKPGGSCYW
jgi:hypothetical protein